MSIARIYQDAILLDRERHRQLKYKVQTTARFARALHAVPLAAVEMTQAVREYPIVFARAAGVDEQPGELICYALTGLRDGQNLFLDADGHWNAHYVPAFIRRYPFVFAETGPEQLSVCIDQSSPGYDAPDGEPFFDEAGEPSALLQGALGLLADYQLEMQRTRAFLQRLDATELLMPAELRADLADGRNALVQGLLVVDEARLQQLSGDKLQEWFASSELGLLYAHLFSLGHVRELMRRMAAPEGVGAAKADTPAQSKKRRVTKA